MALGVTILARIVQLGPTPEPQPAHLPNQSRRYSGFAGLATWNRTDADKKVKVADPGDGVVQSERQLRSSNISKVLHLAD